MLLAFYTYINALPGHFFSAHLTSYTNFALQLAYGIPAVETNSDCHCRCGAAVPHAAVGSFYDVGPITNQFAHCRPVAP
jgi:hypothetical protein